MKKRKKNLLNKDKVSVLMTVFNAENYLELSIKSILNQTYKNWELVIIDDKSSDKSKTIIKKFKSPKIKYFFLKKKLGRTKALNYGLKKCKGKYLAILDADDISFLSRLNEQIYYLKKNKNISLLGSWGIKIDKNNKFLEKITTTKKIDKIKQTMLFKNIFIHSSIIFQKKILNKVGDYPNKLVYMQDYGFILKVMKRYNIYILPKVLTKVRVVKTSMTFNVPGSQIIKEKKLLLKFTWINFKKKIFTIIFWILEYFKVIIKSYINKFFNKYH